MNTEGSQADGQTDSPPDDVNNRGARSDRSDAESAQIREEGVSREEPDEDTTALPEREDAQALVVVGLGGSAGSIPAMEAFFQNLLPAPEKAGAAWPDSKPDPGTAYVVVLHLSPEHESHLAQLLGRSASIPVLQVTEPTRIEAGHVYVIPPARHLEMRDGSLILSEPDPAPNGTRNAIDTFFRTLAIAHGAQSVAVVLSGTGADGTLGLRQVKEAGGLTVVQSPAEAEYDAMPRSAIAGGAVDYVLPAASIPAQIAAYWDTSRRMRLPHEAAPSPNQRLEGTDQETALQDILTQVRVQTGHDFSLYKRATVLRRVGRRMQINNQDTLLLYRDFVRSHPAEVGDLVADLLISVTRFFRDPDVWQTLEQSTLPRLFQSRGPQDEVRAWVCGCATGEEAYTLAMLLLEIAESADTPPRIQVFATDMDVDAVTRARTGIYPETIAGDLSEERLRRWFYRQNGAYQVRKELREAVLFASHDVLRDTPFSRLDLVTCRNLLIYLNRDAQERVFNTFHFALRPDGRLLLGPSESADSASNLFGIVDKQQRLYVRRPVARAMTPPVPIAATALTGQTSLPLPTAENYSLVGTAPPVAAVTAARPIESGRDLLRTLLERYGPPTALIDATYEIVHLSNGAGRFLRVADGEPTRNLLQLVHPNLRIELRTALYAAASEKTDQTRLARTALTENQPPLPIRLTVRPAIETPGGPPVHFLVQFEEFPEGMLPRAAGPPGTGGTVPDAAPPASEDMAHQLEEEIALLQRQLRSTVEQYEALTEELKASNEELQAMNEEQRSAAEELETSKEELQSVNEELTTVNHELKSRVDEVSRANSDLSNFLSSTDIGTLFLDRELRIRRYTPAAEALFNLIPTDTGRPIAHVTNRLNYDTLQSDALLVLARLMPIEREVSGKEGSRQYMVRLLPYRTLDDRIDGVVVNFVDITERKRMETSKFYLASIVESSQDSMLTVDLAGTITSWNQAAEALYGYGASEAIGKPLTMLTLPADLTSVLQNAEKVRDSQKIEIYDTVRINKNGREMNLEMILSLVRDTSGQVIGVSTTARDVTERRMAVERLRESEERMRLLIESAKDYAILMLDNQRRVSSWNMGAQAMFGYADREILGEPGDILFTPEDRKRGVPGREEKIARETGRAVNERWHIRKDGSRFWGSGLVNPLLNEQGNQVGFVKIMRDLTEQRQAEKALRESEKRFRVLVTSSSDALYRMSADWGEMINLKGMDSISDTEAPNREWLAEYIPPQEQPRVLAAIEEAVRSQSIFELEHQVIQADGEVGWTFSRATPLLDAQGNITEWFGSASDITERKRREWQQTFLLKLNDALRPLSDPSEIQRAAMRVVGESLGVDRAMYAEITPDGEKTIVTDNYLSGRFPAVVGEFPLAAYGSIFDKLRSGEQLIVVDIDAETELTEAEKTNYKVIGSTAFVTTPLIKGGRWVSNLVVHQGEPRGWRTEEVAVLQETAERIWGAVERAQTENALRESEERFNLAASFSGFGVHDYDVRSGKLFWSSELKTMHGLAPDAPVDFADFGKHIHPDDGEQVKRAVRTALDPKGSGKFEQEFRIFRADSGETRWLYNRSQTVFDGKGKNKKAVRNTGVVVDITERKSVEDALIESEERLRIAVEAAEMATWDWNLETNEVFWNERHFLLFGMTPPSSANAPLHSDAFVSHVHPGDRDRVLKRLQDATESDKIFEAEFRAVRDDTKETRWMQGYGHVVKKMSDGKPVRMSGVMSDITDRKRAEEAVRENEMRFRTLSDEVPQIIWTNTADGRASYFNRRWFEYSALSYDDSAGPGWQAIVHPDDAPASVLRWNRALAGGIVFDTEYRLRRHDGVYRWFIGRNVPLKDSRGAVAGWFGTATDIDDLKQAEAALANAKETLEVRVDERTEELQAMSQMRQELLRKLVTVQEEERARISRDLHDDTGQIITALLLGLENLKVASPIAADADVLQRLQYLQSLAGEVAQKSHRLSFTLRPTDLDDIGLIGALQNYADQWSRWSGILVEVESVGLEQTDGTSLRLPPEIETTIYRVTQEALTNVLRHALPREVGESQTTYPTVTTKAKLWATRVGILIQRQRRGQSAEVITTIEDDGPGFDSEAALSLPPGKRRLGLFGMQERARLTGGTLSIESELGAGTTIFLRLPFPPEPSVD